MMSTHNNAFLVYWQDLPPYNADKLVIVHTDRECALRDTMGYALEHDETIRIDQIELGKPIGTENSVEIYRFTKFDATQALFNRLHIDIQDPEDICLDRLIAIASCNYPDLANRGDIDWPRLVDIAETFFEGDWDEEEAPVKL